MKLKLVSLWVLVGFILMSSVWGLTPEEYLQALRNSGVSREEAELYLRNIGELERYDALYATNNNLEKFETLQRLYQDENGRAVFASLIQFHKTHGDENPLVRTVNFFRQRGRFYRLFQIEEAAPLSILDLEARLARGEQEERDSHPSKLGIEELAIRNNNLRALVALLKTQKEIPFSTFEELRKASAQIPDKVAAAAKTAIQIPPFAPIVEPKPRRCWSLLRPFGG